MFPTPQAIYRYMRQAIALAEKGLYSTSPNPRVGCVIVRQGKVVGEGFHRQAGQPHAEVYALQQAGAAAKDADVYVSLEPCSHYGRTPPCASALIQAGVKRVFIANRDPNPLVAGQGVATLEQAGIRVYAGILAQKAASLNRGFFKRIEQGMPWITLKMAMSLDGRIAMASGESKWITGETARYDVQKLRARSCAVLTSIKTIEYDNPSMNVRIGNELNPATPIRQPLRVILDRKGALQGSERILKLPGKTRIYTHNPALKQKLAGIQRLEVVVQKKQSHIDLLEVFRDLAKQQINEVHVECGATLAGALVRSGLPDELIIYMAPKLMGSHAMPLFKLPLEHMAEAIAVDIVSIEPVGKDYKITARLGKGSTAE